MSTQVLRVCVPAPLVPPRESDGGLVVAVHQTGTLKLVLVQDAPLGLRGCRAGQAVEPLAAWLRGRYPTFPVCSADVVVRDAEGEFDQVFLEWALDAPQLPPLATWKPLSAAGCLPRSAAAFAERYGREGALALQAMGVV